MSEIMIRVDVEIDDETDVDMGVLGNVRVPVNMHLEDHTVYADLDVLAGGMDEDDLKHLLQEVDVESAVQAIVSLDEAILKKAVDYACQDGLGSLLKHAMEDRTEVFIDSLEEMIMCGGADTLYSSIEREDSPELKRFFLAVAEKYTSDI